MNGCRRKRYASAAYGRLGPCRSPAPQARWGAVWSAVLFSGPSPGPRARLGRLAAGVSLAALGAQGSPGCSSLMPGHSPPPPARSGGLEGPYLAAAARAGAEAGRAGQSPCGLLTAAGAGRRRARRAPLPRRGVLLSARAPAQRRWPPRSATSRRPAGRCSPRPGAARDGRYAGRVVSRVGRRPSSRPRSPPGSCDRRAASQPLAPPGGLAPRPTPFGLLVGEPGVAAAQRGRGRPEGAEAGRRPLRRRTETRLARPPTLASRSWTARPPGLVVPKRRPAKETRSPEGTLSPGGGGRLPEFREPERPPAPGRRAGASWRPRGSTSRRRASPRSPPPAGVLGVGLKSPSAPSRSLMTPFLARPAR